MKNVFTFFTILIFSLFSSITSQNITSNPLTKITELNNFYTPEYYLGTNNDSLKNEIDNFVTYARKISFQHPLENQAGQIPEYTVPANGEFGAVKGSAGTEQYHPAIDMHVGNRETNVTLYAAYDGYVSVYRDAPKYREYLSLTAEIKDSAGTLLGRMVTLYAHIDLDLDSINNILPNNKFVVKGDVISENLYSGTVGGPHLHFEVRYYRATDIGNEEFYSFVGPGGSDVFTVKSAGSWEYGYWKPDVGYGYANPENHWQDGTTNMKSNLSEIPKDFKLYQNYPNPFNPSTTIKYSIVGNGHAHSATDVSLKIYDILGKEVATLVNKQEHAGNYEVRFDASNLNSGLYFYKISAGNFVDVKKMLLIK